MEEPQPHDSQKWVIEPSDYQYITTTTYIYQDNCSLWEQYIPNKIGLYNKKTRSFTKKYLTLNIDFKVENYGINVMPDNIRSLS